MRRLLAVALIACLCASEGRAGVAVGHWVDITVGYSSPVGTVDIVTDSVVVYGTAGAAAGTDLRLGKATAKTRPGRAAVADSINPHWKLLVNHNSTNFPAAYGMGVSATVYQRLAGTTTACNAGNCFESPGVLNVATHTISTDTTWRLDLPFLTVLTDSIQAALTAEHGAGSWTTGSGGLDSAGMSRIIKRTVWGIASGTGSDSSTLLQRTVNVDAIDGGTTSPTWLDESFDNDGTGAPNFHVRQLRVVASSAEDTGLVVYGADAGPAAYFGGGSGGGSALFALGNGAGHAFRLEAGATGNALQLLGGATSGRGLNVSAPGNDWAAVFTGAGTGGGGILSQATAGSGDGFKVTGFGAGSGFEAVGGTTGPGVLAQGGATSGHAVRIQAQAAGSGLVLNGAGASPGIVVDSGIDINGPSYGPAVSLDALSGSNQSALRAIADGTGSAFSLRGGATGRAIRADSGIQFTRASVTHEMHALFDTLNTELGNQRKHMAWDGVLVAGFADSITQQYYPLGGAGNKDSVVFTRWAGATPNRLGKWVFMHGHDPAVADSLRVKP